MEIRAQNPAMHIPDGYLGPSTCVALSGGAAPFWWLSLRRMERALHTKMVPLLSLFSAFSFIVMMRDRSANR